MTNPAYIILLPALFNRAPNGINLPLKVLDKCNIDYCIDRNQDRQHVKKQCLSENPAWPLLQCTAVLQATFTTLIIHKTARGHRNRTQRTRVFYFLVSTVRQPFFPGSQAISIREHGDHYMYFKPNCDVSLTLTKCFVVPEPNKSISTGLCDGRERKNST